MLFCKFLKKIHAVYIIFLFSIIQGFRKIIALFFFFKIINSIVFFYRITTSISDMKLFGVRQNDYIPSLFNSEHGSSDNVLLSISYEKNPLDKLCGDRIIVKSKSVDIVYDAQTIIELVKLFKVPNSSALNQ